MLRMDSDEHRVEAGDVELTKLANRFLDEHPQVRKALEVFQVSQQSYEAGLRALQNKRVYSSNSANETALKRS
jgi:hypothetical protein